MAQKTYRVIATVTVREKRSFPICVDASEHDVEKARKRGLSLDDHMLDHAGDIAMQRLRALYDRPDVAGFHIDTLEVQEAKGEDADAVIGSD